MDKSTIGGMLAAIGLILASIMLSGDIVAFIDPPSIVLVGGGTTGCLFIAYPWPQIRAAMMSLRTAFQMTIIQPDQTVKLLAQLSNRARREGLLSLEAAAEETNDPFLRRGLRMMADGHDAATIESVLYEELSKIDERHKSAYTFWDDIGVYGPAMGLIGTLVGLVLMLRTLDDPTSIGPAMSVALLTTLYGAAVANVFGIPVGAKLKRKSAEELAHKELVAQGLLSILNGENPRFMVERLNGSLPPSQRLGEGGLAHGT